MAKERLIEVMGMREKLLELIRQNPTCIDLGVENCSECQYGNVEDCRSECLVDHLIANDVVQVVRCKDCKHYGYEPYDNGDKCCEYWGEWIFPHEDDFCSCGERKDNDG